MEHNRNTPAAPTPDGYDNGEIRWSGETGFTKYESASLQILCSLLTAHGNRTDEHLVAYAMQLADVWLNKLEVGDDLY